MDPIIVIAACAITAVVAFGCGIAYTRRTLRRNPDKLVALKAQADKVQAAMREARARVQAFADTGP